MSLCNTRTCFTFISDQNLILCREIDLCSNKFLSVYILILAYLFYEYLLFYCKQTLLVLIQLRTLLTVLPHAIILMIF
jgi:hypothetical protein